MIGKRGSFQIELSGTKYQLSPTFEALELYEEKTGKSIFKSLLELRDGDMRISCAVSAIWSGIMGYYISKGTEEKAPQYSEVGKMVVSHGVGYLQKEIYSYFTQCLASDSDIAELDKLSDTDKKKVSKRAKP